MEGLLLVPSPFESLEWIEMEVKVYIEYLRNHIRVRVIALFDWGGYAGWSYLEPTLVCISTVRSIGLMEVNWSLKSEIDHDRFQMCKYHYPMWSGNP